MQHCANMQTTANWQFSKTLVSYRALRFNTLFMAIKNKCLNQQCQTPFHHTGSLC